MPRARPAWPSLALALCALASLASPAAEAAHAPAAAPRPGVWVWSDPAGDGDLARLLEALDRLGAPKHVYDRLGMAAFEADAPTARALRAFAGGRLDPATALPVHLDATVPYVDADAVKASLGLRRDGPTVLIVDTGVDSSHPDFKQGNLVANVRPVRSGGLVVASDEDGPVIDQAGHGTHVAGIVAGSGEALGDSDRDHGRYEGVYANGRLASYQASGVEEGAQAQVEVVAALEAFEWALDNQERLRLRVVSNSWGESGPFDPGHPIAHATLRLYLAGMAVVFSAGNEGEDGAGHLNRYCLAPWVLCVAAGDLQGRRLPFSSEGAPTPGRPYDHPDLTAPGHAVTSARAATEDDAGLVPDAFRASLYVDRSGTSMAAPHVAGAAGLVLAANAQLSPDQVMDILVATARPMGDGVAKAGAGYLDVRDAFVLATRTEGRLATFLAGEDVKYGGTASGDRNFSADPVTVGYGSAGEPLSSRPRAERPWLATPLAPPLLGTAVAVLLVATRWRAA